jgi:predicted AAA+ superfamily ATPase
MDVFEVPASTDLSCRVFDLEDPRHLSALDDPMLALEGLKGLVVLDEIQRKPDLFPVLRVLVDRPDPPARFLVLGSASPDLLRQGSETLAGRIAYHELTGFSLAEVSVDCQEKLWLRGGFPAAFLAGDEEAALLWREEFLRTFLERDLARLGIEVEPHALRRFWAVLAHFHGQVLNSSEVGRTLSVSHTTVRKYLNILVDSLVVRELKPWFANVRKRQVKTSKVYVRDSGLLHVLLGIADREDLSLHPKIGASFEGFALEQIISHLGVDAEDCSFWATHGGAGLDLLVVRGGRRLGFEMKRSSTPRKTKSMQIALADLELEKIEVVHPGNECWPLAPRIRALGLSRIYEELQPLR